MTAVAVVVGEDGEQQQLLYVGPGPQRGARLILLLLLL